jgi:hypothetical protein
LTPLDDWDQASIVETPIKKKKKERSGDTDSYLQLLNDGKRLNTHSKDLVHKKEKLAVGTHVRSQKMTTLKVLYQPKVQQTLEELGIRNFC